MAKEIEWTPDALLAYYDLVVYLERTWSSAVSERLMNRTEHRLHILSLQPSVGIRSEKAPAVRSILLSKHTRLFYQATEDKLIVVGIFDVRKNPDSSPF